MTLRDTGATALAPTSAIWSTWVCKRSTRGWSTISTTPPRARFQRQPEVRSVLYPSLSADPGHAIWKRDFAGATGPFSVLLDPVTATDNAVFLNQLQLCKMGANWGGFENLLVPAWPPR